MKPFTSSGRRWARAAGVFSMLAILVTLTSPVRAASTPLTGSTFDASDGNLVKETGTTDWCNAVDANGLCTTLAPHFAEFKDKPSGQSDDSLSGKEDDVSPTISAGSIPPQKSDLTRMYVAHEKGSNGDIFLYLAWERVQNPTGTTLMDFEVNKNKCEYVNGIKTADSVCAANNVTPARSAGDILLVYGLAAGSTTPTLAYYKWVVSGAKTQCEAANATPCWGKATALDSTKFVASVNSGSTDDPIDAGASQPRSLSAFTFGELEVDLTKAGILSPSGSDACSSYGSVYLKSRTSDQFTSQLADFIAPQAVNVSNCGLIDVKKVTQPAGGSAGFSVSPGAKDLGSGATVSTFSLNDGETKHLAAPVPLNVGSATYTVTETSSSTGYVFNTLLCDPAANASISGQAATITVRPDEKTTCTWTNTKGATLTIQKTSNGGTGTFNFTTSGSAMSNFGITTATSGTPVSNPAFSFGSSSFGDKYVTETANPGWTLTGVSCTGTVTGWAVGTGQGAGFNQGASSGFVAGENTLKVTVGAGDSPTCTFTNTRDQGSIELQKVWSGNGGQTTLQIGTTPGGAEVTSKQTGTGGTAPLSTGTRTVDTGTYYVSESGGLANYTASAPSCFNDNGAGGGTAGNGVKDGSEQTVSVGANGGVSVGKNDKVVCSITNTRQSGSIELKKVWSGTAGQTTLQIGTTSGAHDVANVQTGAAGATPLTTGAMPVDTGTYFVSESGGLGGYTSSLDCVNAANNNAPVTVTSGAVQVGSGDQVVCTFTNTRDRGSIELQKVWSGNGGQTTLQIGTTAGAHDTANVTTGAAGAAPLTTTAKMVDTGTYYVSESGGLTNYTASAPSCFNDNGAGNGTAGNGVKDGGEQTVSVDANGGVSVGKGDKVLCSITNTRKTGTIQVKKVWSGTPGQTTLQIGTTSGGSEVTSKQTGADGAAPLATDVKTVDTGTYYVSESGGLGNYTPSLDCVNTANNNASVTVGSGGAIQVGNGDAIVCTFTNTRMTGTIELDKTWNGPAGSTTLNIGTSAGGSEIASKPVAGNGGIAAKTVDTGTYYVSETPSGNANATDSSLSCVNAANNNAAVAVTNGSVQVGSGDQVVCTFTNTKRFKVIVIVCDRTNDQLYASNVTFDQADATRSIGHGDVSDALEAQLCGLGGATHVGAWDANHTHRADISIGATPTPLSPQAI